jgi:hypothetical protein
VAKTTAKTQIDHTLPVLLLPSDTAFADLSSLVNQTAVGKTHGMNMHDHRPKLGDREGELLSMLGFDIAQGIRPQRFV